MKGISIIFLWEIEFAEKRNEIRGRRMRDYAGAIVADDDVSVVHIQLLLLLTERQGSRIRMMGDFCFS